MSEPFEVYDMEEEPDVIDEYKTVMDCCAVNWGCDSCPHCSHYPQCGEVMTGGKPVNQYDNIKPDYEAEGFMDKRTLVDDLKFWRAERPDEWKMDEFIREVIEKDKVINEMSETISKQDEIIQNYRDRVIKLVEQRDRTERVYDDMEDLKEYIRTLDENDWWLRHEIDERDEEINRLDEQINYWKRSFEHQEEALHDYENNMNDVIKKLRTELDEKEEKHYRVNENWLGCLQIIKDTEQERDELKAELEGVYAERDHYRVALNKKD